MKIEEELALNMDIREKVIRTFNKRLGSNLNNLENLPAFHSELLQKKTEIEKSLSLASTEVPSKIKKLIEDGEEIHEKTEIIYKTSQELQKLLDERCQRNDKLAKIQDTIDKISELEKALIYLRLMKSIEELSSEMESSLSTGNDEAVIASYMELTDIFTGLKSSTCSNLSHFMHETLHYWHNHIKEKMTVDYNEVLKTLKWPFCGSNVQALNTQNAEALARFRILTEYLLNLQLPSEENGNPSVKSALLMDFAPASLPVTLLVRPLKQRFIYHFTGSKQTNRRDKPEWFFTQILTWIKDHIDWIKKHLQPVATVCTGFEHVDFRVEFMRALVQLAVQKLHSELQIVQYDDSLFAHMVDEALGFEKELREALLYPLGQPATVSVLTQAHIFIKWINMEKKYANEKMDTILNSETAWEHLAGADDNMKVTECADAFLTLLMTITDRYAHLPQPGHRLQFLELQLELIDDWRVRLLQLLHEEYEYLLTSSMPRILNTLHYVSTVLMEWGITVHFLKLHYFKKQFEAVEMAMYQEDEIPKDIADQQGTVFDDVVDLLQKLEKKLVMEIADSIILDVKAKSRPYRTDKWFSMQLEKEVVSLSLTPSGCLMFQELSDRLHALKEALALPLFKRAWKDLAIQLDQYLLEELVLVNKFNSGGAAQVQFDITRNLFPLFGLYTNKPESYFPLMKEACMLLNLLLGSAILLIETLEVESEEIVKKTMTDIGIFKMSEETVLMVLKSRMDVSTR